MKQINNDRGSSSILVIILMVVLMIFGISILTTSLSNMRLSEKKKSWISEYYQLEALSEERIARIDSMLIKANNNARQNMHSSSNDLTKVLSDKNNQNELFMQYYCEELLTILDSSIKDNHFKLIDSSLLTDNNKATIKTTPLLLEFDVEMKDVEVPKYITVIIRILPPETNNLTDNYEIINRYEIESYYEWQEPFEYSEGIRFQDPFKN